MPRSPFPGMDPYLEPHWLDVHTRLVTYAADELNRVLPQTLVARAEERVAVESEWDDPAVARFVGPDVRVSSPASADAEPEAGPAIEAPFKLVYEVEPVTERFIRIIDASGQLVTVIEFVSPTNKVGKGLEAYQAKRDELLRAGVNLVEVDLMRRGDWRGLLRPHLCPPAAVAAYRATLRAPPGATAWLYPLPLRRPLIDVPVPLRKEDPRVVLPLQRLVDQVYANGRYGLTLDYSQPCDPPLSKDDAAWADELLKAAGRR